MRWQLLAAGIAIGAALSVALPTPADATSPARIAAAALVARQVGHGGLSGPAPDRALLLDAWHDAGVDTSALTTAADLMHACTMLDASAPRPRGPAPADYVLYRDVAGADRVGMLLSPVDVAIVDAGTVVLVPLPDVEGAIGDATVERLVAEPGSAHVCRLGPWRWPGGRDDTAVGTGRIALADPAQVAEQMTWAAAHPRDADTSLGHTLSRIAACLAMGIGGLLTEAVTALFAALHGLFERLGPLGVPFLLLAGLLGRTFDGRRLHAVLTGIVLVALALALGVGWIIPFGWVIVGAVAAGAAASAAGVPVLGAIGGAMVGGAFAVASFLTGVLTGVDGSSRVCIGTVLFALVADLLWVRPAVTALGIAGHLPPGGALGGVVSRLEALPVLRHVAGDGGSMLDISGTASDVLSLRPQAMLRAARALAAQRAGSESAATDAARAIAAAPPAQRALSTAEAMGGVGGRAVDLVSLAWRPSSVSSDLVGHAADALHLLDTELRTGMPSMPRLRELLLSLDPARRASLLSSIEHGSTHLVPQMQITSRLSHLHSGARALMGLATGQRPSTVWWRLWRSPVMRRVLHGLPGEGTAM
jgi:hypothetical protein